MASSSSTHIKQWQTVKSELCGHFKILDVIRESKRSPITEEEHNFYIVQCPDWVNVIALTNREELVMVKQYRHGTNTVELEIPGGVIDETDYTPLKAGLRELLEETGYEGDHAYVLGSIFPNPAFIRNRCYVVVVEGAYKSSYTRFDPLEDISTELIPLSQVPFLIKEHKINNAIVLAALLKFFLHKGLMLSF